MRNFNKKYILAFVCLLNYVIALPVPSLKTFRTITQPDGTTLTVQLVGDENFHYYITADGYPLVTDSTGLFTYATQTSAGNLISTGIKASEITLRTNDQITLLTTLSKTIIRQKSTRQRSRSQVSDNVAKKVYPTNGSPKSLVILVNFSDKSFVTNSPQLSFTSLLNQDGYSTNGGTGSAKDYFRDNSMGKFVPEFDVYGPYTLPNSMSYYGSNDNSGNDKNPQQMVIDACSLANKDVDFSVYDTDKDGILDNVFIYYAGYNEAEGGPATTVWPHRWSLNNYNTKFDGISVFDYACTSELKGTAGSNMCGIGTFCHEFGHVLGLNDLYVTDATIADHFTLSSWDIMDYGPYLNSGRTPPYYSAYERFYLGWLTPTEITNTGSYSLDTLSTKNKAYLLSLYGNHNLDGQNPNPLEFFLLENRQKKGWDTYLPGHGMLITRIYFNKITWDNNTINNDINAMGIDLMEADGIASDATMSADPFPGTANITKYTPRLRAGTKVNKPISQIKETNGIIGFTVSAISEPTLYTDYTNFSFTSQLNSTSKNTTIKLSGINLQANASISFKSASQNKSTHYQITTDTIKGPWQSTLSIAPNSDQEVSQNIYIRFAPTIMPYPDLITDSLIITSYGAETNYISLTGAVESGKIITYSNNGILRITAPYINQPVYIFNSVGQLVKSVTPTEKTFSVHGLSKFQIYIIKQNKAVTKAILY